MALVLLTDSAFTDQCVSEHVFLLLLEQLNPHTVNRIALGYGMQSNHPGLHCYYSVPSSLEEPSSINRPFDDQLKGSYSRDNFRM